MKTKKQNTKYINLFLFVLFVAAIVVVSIKFAPSITALLSSPEKARGFLLSFGFKSVFVFILLQVLQVVIAVIPGEVVQITGGYVYGIFLGTVYSVVGILLGSLLAFFLVRIIGYPVVKAFVPQKQLNKFNFMINNEKSEITMFVLFLIPGLPKDVLTYIAGLTPVKPLRLFIIVMIARLPGILVSSVIGTNIQSKNYLTVVIISVCAIVLFVAGLLLKNRIIDAVAKYKKSNL